MKKGKYYLKILAMVFMLILSFCVPSSAEEAGDGTAPGTEVQTGDALSEAEAQADGALPEAEAQAAEIDMDDGEYSIEVAMTGGSGRASISSPARFTVKDGRAYATLIWSSSHYDYMIVGGGKYFNTNEGGSSTFEVPVTAFDTPVMVVADTDAMGEPLEIDYAITYYRESIGSTNDIPQVAAQKVLITGLTVIIAGGILNLLVKRRRRRAGNAAARRKG